MISNNASSVLFLNDGRAICCYCGKPLKVEYKEDWDECDLSRWNEYECTCDDWNKAVELNNRLKELNDNFYKEYCKYRNDFSDLCDVNRLNRNEKMYGLEKYK